MGYSLDRAGADPEHLSDQIWAVETPGHDACTTGRDFAAFRTANGHVTLPYLSIFTYRWIVHWQGRYLETCDQETCYLE